MKTVYNDEWLDEAMAEMTEEEKVIFLRQVGCAYSVALMAVNRERFPEMEPAERRLFCKDMETQSAPFFGKETGKFFNEMAGSPGPRKTDDRELGRRIMAKRNVNYKGTDPAEEGRII